MTGDLIFSRWNGWDDFIILVCQWIASHIWKRHLRPYWRWTHVQVHSRTPGSIYEASWPRVILTTIAENTAENGLIAQRSARVLLTDTQRRDSAYYCECRLGEHYSLVRFIAIGIKLVFRLRLPLALQGDVCSTLAASADRFADARWLSPMELAALVGCPY